MNGRPGLPNHPHNRAAGTAAEQAAATWLHRQGYDILLRNYRTKPGEIDLIATEAGTLCFLEIKARTGRGFGPAVGAVDLRKQHRIARAASVYLAQSGWTGPCRFDVLGLERRPNGAWTFDLIRDAFQIDTS